MSTRSVNRGERLTIIERLLFRNGQGLRAVEIAESCGVDRRTIYRDLATLDKLGVPVYQQDGRFFIKRDYYLAPMRMNFNEAMALFIAARAYSRIGEQQNPHLVSALNKLCAALPEPLASHVGYVTDWIRASPVDRNYMQVLETIIRGWVERRRVKLWASSKTGSLFTREFATYFIEPLPSGGLLVVGWDEANRSIRSLQVSAIKRVKLLDTSYEIPESLDRRPYLESTWGVTSIDAGERSEVVLAFAPDVTPLIRERLWHPSQRIETLPDKRCTLTVHVSDWREILPWVRSWGLAVEVLEPTALRLELGAEAANAASLYQRTPARSR